MLKAQALNEGDEFNSDLLSPRLHAVQLSSLSHVHVAKALTAADDPDWQKPLSSSVITRSEDRAYPYG